MRQVAEHLEVTNNHQLLSIAGPLERFERIAVKAGLRHVQAPLDLCYGVKRAKFSIPIASIRTRLPV
jgi:hypothetical protein